jgi:hypothetical protein
VGGSFERAGLLLGFCADIAGLNEVAAPDGIAATFEPLGVGVDDAVLTGCAVRTGGVGRRNWPALVEDVVGVGVCWMGFWGAAPRLGRETVGGWSGPMASE